MFFFFLTVRLPGLDRGHQGTRPPTPVPCRGAAEAHEPANTAMTIITNGAAGVAVGVGVGVRVAVNTVMTIVTNSAAGVVARRKASRIATTGLIGIDRPRGPGIVNTTSCRQRMGIMTSRVVAAAAVVSMVGSRGSFQGYMFA